MNLLKNTAIIGLLFVVLCFTGGELHSHHTVANGQLPHPDVHVGNSAYAGHYHSSATVAPYVEGVELGIHDNSYECYGKIEVDDLGVIISGSHRKKAPKLFAIIKKTSKKHKLSIKLSPGQTSVELPGIGKVSTSTGASATFLGNVDTGYTVEWTAEKMKLNPKFKKLKGLALHWTVYVGDKFTGWAYGSAWGRNTNDTKECKATCIMRRGWLGIPYGSARCEGNTNDTF